MTEKRFVDYFDKDYNYIIQDLQNEDEYQVGFVNCDEDFFLELVNNLNDENEQLKQRNNRQAKRLDELYELMAKEDWKSLTEIIDDFKRYEEQLQREWESYE